MLLVTYEIWFLGSTGLWLFRIYCSGKFLVFFSCLLVFLFVTLSLVVSLIYLLHLMVRDESEGIMGTDGVRDVVTNQSGTDGCLPC